MLTEEEAKEILKDMGVTLPGFLLSLILEDMASIQTCLEEHYTPAQARLILAYLLALIALAQGDKYISSQTGPNGASRSFRYQQMRDMWAARSALLRKVDKFNCAGELIPDDPFKKGAGLWVSVSGCTK